MVMSKVKWLGHETNCDMCSASLSADVVEYFVDCKIKQGPWALLCPHCFEQYGVGLGLGLGQKYDAETRCKIAG
jgi:hypothetical protein